VERYIDEISLYKINYLHLHLTDDQGWRIAINGWPALTEIGGSTQVGGGPGGYYTQADYSAIVDYAASRYITVIPEIDMPGHTNAALASYAGLNCNGVAPKPYRGVDVGFSSLCVSLPKTYDFVDQVVGQLAGLTPGPYIHIGGDESTATNDVDYAKFIERAQQIVVDHGKTAIGWHDVATAKLLPSTVAEFWDTSKQNAPTASAVASGTKVIMAPANHTYLDMKYNPGTTLGTSWAAMYDVNEAYGWNPGAYLEGVGESAVLGVEAPLWTETIVTPDDIDYMAFPRLPAIAELGWSPWSTHNEAAFLDRMAAQEPLWRAMGIHFYPSQQVRWAPQP
jgi:hexosaminidase